MWVGCLDLKKKAQFTKFSAPFVLLDSLEDEKAILTIISPYAYKTLFSDILAIIFFTDLLKQHSEASIWKQNLDLSDHMLSNNHHRHHHHHHHQVIQIAWIPVNLLRYPSLSAIAFGRSSRLHPTSAQCIYFSANTGVFERKSPQENITYERVIVYLAVHYISSSSLIVCEMEGK